MNTGNAFWTAGVSCLYFSLLHLFQFYAQADLVFVVMILFIGMAVHIAGGFPKVGKALGFLFLIVPVIGASQILPSITSLIAILPPIIYASYMIVKGNEKTLYWEKKQHFLVLTVAFGIGLFIGLGIGRDMTMSVAYVFPYLLFMSLALNLFRYGQAVDKKGKFLYFLNLGLYTLTSGACACLVHFIGTKGSKIIEIILTPFAMILAAIVSLFASQTPVIVEEVEKMKEQSETVENLATQNQQTVIEQATSNDVSGGLLDLVVQVVLVALIILFLAYLFYKIYCFYKGRYVQTDDVSEVTGTTETIGRKGFGKINLFKTNREKIRKEYVKHMRSVRGLGGHISKSSTSLDVCSEAKARLNHEDVTEERIRELYIKARYSNEEISDEDVKEMRQLV